MSKLYGLILAGGKSRRMGEDKATLAYHGKSQIEFCGELLADCEEVFVSLRKEQEEQFSPIPFPVIYDKEDGKGPLDGILSAMKAYPDAAWLVVGCDLPFLTQETIRHLITRRDSSQLGIAYVSENDGLPEPLCAIYEPHTLPSLQDFYDQGFLCPRKWWINTDGVELIKLQQANALDNVNTVEEREDALKNLSPRA